MTTTDKEFNLLDSLEQSLKEMQLIRAGKVKAKSWDECMKELEQEDNE